MTVPEELTVPQAAVYLKVSEETVRRVKVIDPSAET